MSNKIEFGSLLKTFELLKAEHDLTLNILQDEIETGNHVEKELVKSELPRVINSCGRLDIAIEDIRLLIHFTDYVKKHEEEKKYYHYDYKKLADECNWLRDEVTRLQNNLRLSEEKVVMLEEDNKNLQFMLQLKSYDEDLAADPLKLNKENIDNIEITDGQFLPENDNKEQIMNTDHMNTNPTQSVGYELPPRLKTLHNLVIQYASQGRYEVAIPLCKQTLEDLESSSGRNHPDVATMLNILALIYRDQNKYSDSIMLLKEALTIRENTLGPLNPAIAATLNNLAVLYGKQRKYKEAEPYGRRSLLIREQILGPDHPDVAKQLINVALLCQNGEKFSDAEQYYRRAIDIYTAAIGINCDDVIKTKNNLATMYVKQKKYKEAEMIYKEIITVVHEKLCGEIAPNNKPIWMLAEEKQYGSQEINFSSQQDDKDSWEKINSSDWSSIFCTMKNLASLYQRQNKNDAAQIVEDLANKNNMEKVPFDNPHTNMYQSSRTSSMTSQQHHSLYQPNPMTTSAYYVGVDGWSVPRTQKMKTNLQMKPNNLNRSSGPIRGSRSSLTDKFTNKLSNLNQNNNMNNYNDAMLSPTGHFPGEGRLKKASSMSLLPGAPAKTPSGQRSMAPQNSTNNNRSSNQKTPMSESWLSRGRTASIENIKKGFGKRP